MIDSMIGVLPSLFPPGRQETDNEGRELYLHFFHEQLRQQGLSERVRMEEDRELRVYHDESVHDHHRRRSLDLENFQVNVSRL